ITLPALRRYSSRGLIDRAAEKTVSEEMCRTLNIKAPSIETKAANLSVGNQQKLVPAKGRSLDPKVLICAEPTGGIDVAPKAASYQIMRKLAQNGVTIIMISSDMEEVLGESDRIAVMHEGSITGILERDQCTEEAVMLLAVGKSYE